MQRGEKWPDDLFKLVEARVAAGRTYAEIAAEFSILTKGAIKNKFYRLHHPAPFKASWPAEKVEALKALIDAGKTSGEIAAKLHMTRSSICCKVKRLKLKFLSRFSAAAVAERRKNKPVRRAKPPKTNSGWIGIKPVKKGEVNGRGQVAVATAKPGKWPADWVLKPKPDRMVDRYEPPGAFFGHDVVNLRRTQCRWTFDIEGGTRRVYCKEEQIDEKHPYCKAHAWRVYEGWPEPEDDSEVDSGLAAGGECVAGNGDGDHLYHTPDHLPTTDAPITKRNRYGFNAPGPTVGGGR